MQLLNRIVHHQLKIRSLLIFKQNWDKCAGKQKVESEKEPVEAVLDRLMEAMVAEDSDAGQAAILRFDRNFQQAPA